MAALNDLKEFNFLESEVSLWTFKGTLPKTNGHWIETSDKLDAEIKNITLAQLEKLTEQQEYSLLAQNNEASVLSILTDETHAGIIRDCIRQNLPQRKIKDVKTLRNAKFYVAKFVCEDKVVFAARKTDPSWATKKLKTILNVIYKENELDISSNEGFRIQRSFDFFCR